MSRQSESEQQRVNLVVAHNLEARPLIDLFGMKKQQLDLAYPVYRNERGLGLIVSGMGKLAAAAASASLAAAQDGAESSSYAWLNIGIAGHRSANIGCGLLAQKITEAASASSYYPSLLISGFSCTDIISVDQPELSYAEDAAYDMEAFGFYSTASRFVTSELVQVFKIISDNPAHPATKLNTSRVYEWVDAQASTIKRLVQELNGLATEYHVITQVPPEVEQLSAGLRLSVTQRTQLIRLCQRYHAMGMSGQLHSLLEGKRVSGKQLMQALEQGLTGLS